MTSPGPARNTLYVSADVRICPNGIRWKWGKKMAKEQIHGIHAALLTPRNSHGHLDQGELERQLGFLLDSGIRGFALNGATGEFCLTSQDDLKRCLLTASSTLPAGSTLLCGIGAARLEDAVALGRIAIEHNVAGLLLPMPYFFRYAQDDLEVFAQAVARELAVPIILYNLPQFSSGLEAETVISLIRGCRNIVGIKDSSGSLSILRALTETRVSASRIIGNDGVLAAALTDGLCDGVVSGVACVLPEMIQMLFAAQTGSDAFIETEHMLAELLAKLDDLPVPWGLKAIAEAREIACTSYHLPASPRRAQQIQEIQAWLPGWLQRVDAIGDLDRENSLRKTSTSA